MLAAAGVALVLLALGGSALVWTATTRAQGPLDVLFQLLPHPDRSLPGAVATVDGVPVPAGDYQGHLAMLEACIQTPSCPSAAKETALGPENAALTAAVIDVLLEQYGKAHGISVTDAEVTAALQDQVVAMHKAAALGTTAAGAVRQNLALGHLTDPSQIVNDPGWRDHMRHSILRGKTLDAFVVQRLPAEQRGGPETVPAEYDFEQRLIQSSRIQIKIPAHLIDPHTQLPDSSPPAPPMAPPRPLIAPPGARLIQSLSPGRSSHRR